MTKTSNLIGEKFGKLTVIRKSNVKKYGVFLWECKCDCGKTTYVSTNSLTSGNTRSCGCYKYSGLYHPKHNAYKTHLYYVWASMKKRCYNNKDKYFYCYGAKGVKVCEEWKKDFASFRKWALQNGYKEEKLKSGINKLTLDRINSDGDYTPDNCRWVDMTVQNNNKKKIKRYHYKGESHTITEWCKIKEISFGTLFDRLNKLGWSIDKALEAKIQFHPTSKGE